MDHPFLDVRTINVCIQTIKTMFQSLSLFQTSIHPSSHHSDYHSLLHNWTTYLHVSTRNARVSLYFNKCQRRISFCFSDDSEIYCGLSSRASIEWKKYFNEIHFGFNHFTIRCIFSELIPTGAVILFNFYIISHLIRKHRRLHQPQREHSRTTSWMNIVLLLHALLFLGSLLSHIVGHFIMSEAHEAWWVLLAILINSSINFYLYCLSGKAFRNEIYRWIQKVRIQLFRKLDIRDDRYYRDDEIDIINMVIPLRRQHVNDFHQHFLRS